MSGILFSKGRDFGLVLGASMRSIASQGLVLFASSIAFGLALRSSSARLDLFASSIAFGLALGASNARLVLTHV